MSLDLGTLEGVDGTSKTAHQRTMRYINQLEARIVALTSNQGRPYPLTTEQLAQIQQALQSTGSHPLNLTGLTGTPTKSP